MNTTSNGDPTHASMALEGLRVLDIGNFIAAPYAATVMAEFGAEVLKVELPGVGDHCRRLGTPTECGDTLVWLSEGRNKRSVTVDLRTPEGSALFRQLAAKSDVVCENFKAGTLERWGLGYEALSKDNPGLILLRISGYGQFGPYADRPCFGRIANAFGGISFLSGDADRPPAQPGSATLADYMAGLYGALGVQFALQARAKTGRGQVIDIGLYETIFRILDEVAPAYQRTGFIRRREGADTPIVSPHSHYPTADERWVAIACTNDRIFGRLADEMGRPDMKSDPRFATNGERIKRRGEVNGIVADWSRQFSRDEVLSRCAKGEIPCGPVYGIDEIFEDPHYAARGNILHFEDPRVGTVAIPNVVPRMEGTPGRVKWLGRPLAADTDAVLQEVLGLSAPEIAELRAKGAI